MLFSYHETPGSSTEFTLLYTLAARECYSIRTWGEWEQTWNQRSDWHWAEARRADWPIWACSRCSRTPQVPIDMIAGTSLGALIGGLYALRPEADFWTAKVEQFLHSFRSRKTRLEFIRRLEEPDTRNHGFFSDMANLIRKGYFWGITATKPAFISEQEYEEFIYPLIPERMIEETKIPFGCVATDIRNGKRVVYRTGPLRRAISASCALPGIFPPVVDGNMLLVDGGWVERVPVRAARDMGADIVIAVDVSSEIGKFEDKFGLDVVLRADAVSRIYLNEILVQEADVLIHPAVGATHWADFSNFRGALPPGRNRRPRKACFGPHPDLPDIH